MRILVLSDLYPPVVRGGYEVECHDVVEHLRERHEVAVLTSVLERGRADAEPGVLRVLPWSGEGSRAESLRAAPDAWRAARATRRALAVVRPEVLYCWNAGGVPASALWALQRHGAPLLVRACEQWFGRVYANDQLTRHLPQDGRRPHGAWDRAMQAANRLGGLGIDPDVAAPAAVSWNSAFTRRSSGVPPAVRVVHEAVTFPANARMLELDGLARAPVPGRVLFVGRLDEAKGAAVLVRALGRLRAGPVPGATLHLVGEGTAGQRAALVGLAEGLGLGGAVRLTGPLRGEAFAAEVAGAAAWSVPSVWDEPAGLTCVEAAVSRVPVVLSRVGGIPELLQADAHALFHERGDVEGCAAALAATLAGGPEVDARVQRARARGLELSFPPYLAAMDAFLRDGVAALGGPAPAGP